MFAPSTGMVGRDQELAELVARCSPAPPIAQLLILYGDPGSGRTSLARAAAQRLSASGTAVHWAEGSADERDLPGGVLRQLAPDDEPSWLPQVSATPSAQDLVAFGDEVATRLGADGLPHLLVVDDADLADPSSLGALRALMRHHRNLPLTVLLVADDAMPDVPAAWRGALHGLDLDAVSRLAALAGRPIPEALALRLHRHTEGNPGDLLDLLHERDTPAWQDVGLELPSPPRVRRQVAAALADADPTVRRVLGLLAVLAAPVPLARLVDVGIATPHDDLFRLADQVEATQLTVRTPAPGLALRRPLYAPALAATLPQADLMHLRRRLAQTSHEPAEALQHLARANPLPDEELAAQLDQAARARAADGAWRGAADLWQLAAARSAEPLHRDDRRAHALEALVGAGEIGEARELATVVAAQRETALADAALGYLALNRGRRQQAAHLLQRAQDIVSDRDREVAARISAHRELHALCELRGGELVDWADRTTGLAGPGSAASIEAQAIRGLGLAMAGDLSAARQHYTSQSRRIDGTAQEQRFAMARGWLALAEDDLESARVELENGSMLTRDGSRRIALWSQAWLVRVSLLTGEWTEGQALLDRGLALAQQSGISLVLPLLYWSATELHVGRGEWQQAEAAIRSAQRHTHGYRIARAVTQLAQAELAQAQARHDQAVRLLEPLQGVDMPAFLPWHHIYASSLVMSGQLLAAQRFLDQQLGPHTEGAGAGNAPRARLGVVRGRLLGAQGELDAARDCFVEATAWLEAAGLVYDTARARLAAGQTMRRAGRRREADELLRRAQQTFLAIGATTLVARCEQEVTAGGLGESGRSVRSDVTLTPQEQTVAELVARGMSNRDVASRLYLSSKTVQYHLTRVYAKLGVRSRTELAAVWSFSPKPPE